MNFDALGFGILVCILSIFVFRKRKEIEVVKVLPPIMNFYMYRTSIGIALMDKIANRFGSFLAKAAKYVVPFGFAGMVFVCFEMIRSLINTIMHPSAVSGVSLVLPFEAKGVFYVPFVYWILSILIVVIVHEFCHGLYSRVWKVPVLSSGFAFLSILLPIVPAAFVEPDERKLRKKSTLNQLAVFAAGPVSNLIFGLLLMGISLSFTNYIINPMHTYEGLQVVGFHIDTSFPIHSTGMTKGEVIKVVNSVPITKLADLNKAMDGAKPGDVMPVKTDLKEYQVTLGPHPHDGSKPYLGVMVKQKRVLDNPTFFRSFLVWIDGLVFWVFVLSLGVGFFNLLPLGIVDGGRMFHTAAAYLIGEEKAVKVYHAVSACFLFVIFAGLAMNFFR